MPMYIVFQVKQILIADSLFGSEKQFHNRIDSLEIKYKIGYRPYEYSPEYELTVAVEYKEWEVIYFMYLSVVLW